MTTARKLIFASILMTLAFGCSQSSDSGGPGTGPGPDGMQPGEPDGPAPDGMSTDHKPGVTPDEGATEFLSADSAAGASGSSRSSSDGLANAGAPAADAELGGGAGSDPRSVERGDIFRVLDDGRILNLNAYRGLQVIDVRDLSAPKIEGRLDVTGTPIEMYVVGDRAIVLLNNWYGYYGNREDVSVEVEEGGLVAVIDISDRSHPVLLDDAHVPGNISTSRLTQGGGGIALYVASQDYGEYDQATGNSGERTMVRSFDASGETLVMKDHLDLGGYVQDIQATTNVLMVASTEYDNNTGEQHSRVGLIDISSPDGAMVMGDEIVPSGYVQNKFNLDVTGDVLRIVSGSTWGATQTNHLETYDVSDLGNATPIDHCTFGDGQNLFATLFVENKAFFVTYLRQDPFHAFEIDAAGQCQEHAEFVVSGWNDFFRAVSNDTRLIGIGRNDETRLNALAVSLYDISNIANPNPLLQRAEIDLTWASSEASWDDRAFSVLEGAVSIQSSNGVAETGLVLLPFEGWNENDQTYQASVQLFTFSDSTITKRGVMEHGTSVRRSFLTDDSTAANLSEDQLSLYSITTPDAPDELGRVDVAPSFNKVLVYGDYVARVRDRGRYYYGSAEHTPNALVEIVPRSGNLDLDVAIASFEIPSGSTVTQVGDLLVSTYSEYVTSTQVGDSYKDTYQTSIAVFDLSDPSSPDARGTLTTDRISPYYGGGYWLHGDIGLAADCFDCGRGGYYGGNNSQLVAGDAIVFPTSHSEQRSIGDVEYCYEYAESQGCGVSSDGTSDCPDTYYSGGITCETPESTGVEWCTGEFYECSYSSGECTVVDSVPRTYNGCNTYEQFRYWTWYSFEVLDLSNPDAPSLAPSIEMAHDEEGSSLLASGTDIYVNYQKPATVNDDPRPYVRRYFRKLDVSNPASAELGAAINIPGEVIAVDDGSIFTRDVIWDSFESETLVARLEVDGSVARLRAQRLFDDRYVAAVTPDEAGHVLVSHDPAWSYGSSNNMVGHTLSILDNDDLGVAGSLEVDAWASFNAAKAGKAVFSVSGGLLVINVENAAQPAAQAYFATEGYWMPELLLDGGEILLASGPYGIHRFDSDTYNLRSR